MTKKVLIVYGSRFGSTEEISIKFKESLENQGYIVDLVNLKAKNNKKPRINDYTSVLIGSGIRVTRWTKEAKNFLKMNANYINENRILVGIFLSSGEAADPVKRPEIINEYLVKVLNELALDLGDHVLYDAFGGVLDLTNTSNLGWLNKKNVENGSKRRS